MVKLKCVGQGTWVFHGVPSRNVYQFDDTNNHELLVENADLLDLLSKKQVSGGCCGIPHNETDLFEIIE